MDPNSASNWLGAQMSAIAQAPVPFFACLLALGFVIWRVVEWHYKARLSDAASKNDLLENRLTDYREKLDGASPDAAKAKIDALEARLNALEPARLSEDQKDKMRAALSGHRGHQITVTTDSAAARAQVMSRQMAELFREQGWTVLCPMVLGIGRPPGTGIALILRSSENLTAPQEAIRQALIAAGLKFDVQQGGAMHGPLDRIESVAEILFSNPFET